MFSKITPWVFAKIVVKAYQEGRGIFSKRINAEELIPKQANDLQKTLYLFYITQLDYAVRSQNLYRGAQKLFFDNPSFFTPEYLKQLSTKRLEETIKNYLKPRYINEAIRRYRENSKILQLKYNSDPRKIFELSSSVKEVRERLKAFRGFGPKIGNFFIRTMVNTFAYQYKDIDKLLPPVDIHDVRVAYFLGFVKSQEMSSKNIKKVKEIWSNACKRAGVSWLVFDKALWLLGSQGRPKSKEDIYQLVGLS